MPGGSWLRVVRPQAVAKIPPPVGGGGKTILVVDDEPSIRLLCRVNLELERYRVLEAGTLDDARSLLEQEDVDVLLLDLHVSGADGATLLRELQDRESGTRVALLTGTVDLKELDVAMADAVLAKPFSLETLVGTVQTLADAGARTEWR
jgi:DNA-binding NtrC family response regulator